MASQIDPNKNVQTGQTKDALPFAGGFAPHTGNLISKLIYHPCSIPFEVYVETFIPSFIWMVITIITWDFNDVVRAGGYANLPPKGSKGSGGKRHIKRGKITSHLTPTQAKTAEGLRHVLKWTEPLEKIGYLMLLYNATEQFAANWTSLLNNFEHCGKPESEGPLQRSATNLLLPSPNAPQPLFLPDLLQNRASWPTSNQLVSVPFGHYSVTLSATFKNQAINDYEFRVGFDAPFSLAIGTQWSEWVKVGPGGGSTAMIHEDIFFPTLVGGSIQWFYEGSALPIGVLIESADVSIYSWQPGR